MRYVRLVAADDEYQRDKPGLIVKGTKPYAGMMVDTDGLMTAHDLIEHQYGVAKIGPADDELIACGSIWQCRGRWGDLMTESLHSCEEGIAADVVRIAEDLHQQDWYPGKRRYRTQRHWQDESFDAILECARIDLRQVDFDPAFPIDQYLADAKHLMRIGYRRADRRFGNRFGSNNLFRAIKEAVGETLKYGVEYVGQEFILGYGNGRAVCKPVPDEDYE